MNILAKPYEPLNLGYSNRGTVSMSSSGTGRNVAENLARLEIPVNLVASFGTDLFGTIMLEECRTLGINTDFSQITGNTSVHNMILNHNGSTNFGVVTDNNLIGAEHIKDLDIADSQITVIEAGVYEREILDGLSECIYMLADTNLKKLQGHSLQQFHTIQTTAAEATNLSGFKVMGDSSLNKIGTWFMKAGAKRLIIYLGKKGIYYRTNDDEIRHKPPRVDIKNAVGASAAFMAGVIYGSYHKKSPEYTIGFAQALAETTSSVDSSVSKKIDPLTIERLNLWRNF